MAKELWVSKYQPTTIDDYVFKDNHLKEQVKAWIKDGKIPHLLLHGSPGTGKSSLANVLINELDIHDNDVLIMNGSDTNSVDDVRNKILNFVQSWAFGDYRVVLINEFDYFSQAAQGALRDILEKYENNARFIFTLNYPHKVIPAIKSRTQDIQIQKVDKDQFILKLAEILVNENIQVDGDAEKVLNIYVEAYYPDLRKTINMIQHNCLDGRLHLPQETGNTADWQIEAAAHFAEGNIKQGREIVCKQLRVEECEEFFKMCYRNLDWWADTPEKQDQAVLVIRDAVVKHSVIADHELNISAMLIELSQICNS